MWLVRQNNYKLVLKKKTIHSLVKKCELSYNDEKNEKNLWFNICILDTYNIIKKFFNISKRNKNFLKIKNIIIIKFKRKKNL